MDSYEIVKRAITFENPERMPYWCHYLDFGDITAVNYDMPITRISDTESIDEWGCIWKTLGGKDVVFEPINQPIADLGMLSKYCWPSPDVAGKFDDAKKKLERIKGDRKFVYGCIDSLFARSMFLRGWENTMMDFCLNPEKLCEIFDGVLEYDLACLGHYSKLNGIHGILMPDDWGTQAQPFLSNDLFRKTMKPFYKKLFDKIHSYGWFVRLHSDGKINDLIEEFIDCGLDVIELEQPQALGIEEIGRRYRGRICFEAAIDIQRTLPTSDEAVIREEAMQLLNNWATPQGGFIAVVAHGPDIGVSEDDLSTAMKVYRDCSEEYCKKTTYRKYQIRKDVHYAK